MEKCLAFIGGSGLYNLDFLENSRLLDLNSSWGNPSNKIIEGYIERHKVNRKKMITNLNHF